MSETWLTAEQEASVTIAYADGRTLEFPRVQMRETGLAFEDRDLPWHHTRTTYMIQIAFHPLEPWVTKLLPPETKAEKRARLIKEMYPAGSA